MSREQTIGQLIVLANNTDGAMPQPLTASQQPACLSNKDVLADWVATVYQSGTINVEELRDYMRAIDQCHDEVANVLLAYARAEG